MKCKYHAQNEAQAICEKCKTPICSDCVITVADRTVCRHCIQENLFAPQQQEIKRPFLERFMFFCVSLVPGAAHMQLGLFRRGIQLMLITFGTIALAGYINLNFFIPVVVIPTWFFSFFESHNLKKQMWQGQTLTDQDIFKQSLFGDSSLLKNHRVMGILIIVIGVMGLLEVVGSSGFVLNLLGNSYFLVKSSLFPVLLILGGIYLITKSKRASENLSFEKE